MNFSFICLVIQHLFILEIHAQYNKDVLCILDKGRSPICSIVPKTRRSGSTVSDDLPSYDPYIPRANTVLYNCSSTKCDAFKLYSITQVTSPELQLRSCHAQSDDYECETIRYNYFKNIDKLLFLTKNVKSKTFYTVNCLVYSDRRRVCHKKDNSDSHVNLIDTGTIVRPNEPNVLSLDEFICEEGEGIIHCDLNPLIPYLSGLKMKESIKFEGDILLKTGNYVVNLKKNCVGTWCGFTGVLKRPSRRSIKYEHPGGKVFQCYYAKKQQICKMLTKSQGMPVYNERDYLTS